MPHAEPRPPRPVAPWGRARAGELPLPCALRLALCWNSGLDAVWLLGFGREVTIGRRQFISATTVARNSATTQGRHWRRKGCTQQRNNGYGRLRATVQQRLDAHRATVQPCNRATVQPCNKATRQQGNKATTVVCNRTTRQQDNRTTGQQDNRTTGQQDNNDCAQLCNRATVQPCNNATPIGGHALGPTRKAPHRRRAGGGESRALERLSSRRPGPPRARPS
jgi:hypothetical protein